MTDVTTDSAQATQTTQSTQPTQTEPTGAEDPRGRQEPGGTPWWREAVIYQVYPRSFSDSDGDGLGDLPGITSRLPYLAGLGVDAVWLSPFYVSPMADAGYDVADYRNIDPIFGTLADADAMIATATRLGLRVIVDLVPNHTSDEHPWFTQAVSAGRGSRERARYMFSEGLGEGGGQPPNNWRSVFGGPAWTRVVEPDGAPGQWYLHLFDVKQPDLDWSNADVREEFHDILRFWMERGVAGFRVDVASGLVKADGLPEWEHEQQLLDGANEAGERPPMWDQDGVHEIYRGWRSVVDEFDDRILVAEAWVAPVERLARYVRPDEMHQAFNFEYLKTKWRAADLREAVQMSIATMDAVGATTTWVLSNHDVVRHATRFAFDADMQLHNGIGAGDPQPDEELGLRRARAATLLMLGLPGSSYIYQGEELGLPEHTTMPDDARQDPTWLRSGHTIPGRDGCRVPIPWVSTEPAYGFSSTGRTWLPQPESFGRHAADLQDGLPGSTLEMYRDALRLRRVHRLGAGSLTWLDAGDDALAIRIGDVVVVTNLGPRPVDLPAGEVLVASADLDDAGHLPTDVTAWVRTGR